MTKEPTAQDTRKLIGRAIALLRERAGLTQEQAGDAAGMSAQYFGMHELGKVKGLAHPEVQHKLLRAVNATPEDLDTILAELTDETPSVARIARIARELGSSPSGPPMRQAIFPTSEGDVTVILPANFSPAGFKQLEDYLAVFIRSNIPANTH